MIGKTSGNMLYVHVNENGMFAYKDPGTGETVEANFVGGTFAGVSLYEDPGNDKVPGGTKFQIKYIWKPDTGSPVTYMVKCTYPSNFMYTFLRYLPLLTGKYADRITRVRIRQGDKKKVSFASVDVLDDVTGEWIKPEGRTEMPENPEDRLDWAVDMMADHNVTVDEPKEYPKDDDDPFADPEPPQEADNPFAGASSTAEPIPPARITLTARNVSVEVTLDHDLADAALVRKAEDAVSKTGQYARKYMAKLLAEAGIQYGVSLTVTAAEFIIGWMEVAPLNVKAELYSEVKRGTEPK